ncbi:ribose-phosphate diphosphokinase [Patescibacteria group bacterium]
MASVKKPVVFSGTANKPFARRLAKELSVKLGKVDIKTFSDQETHILVEDNVKGRDVYVVQSTSMPVNENLMELLLLVHSIKSLKPKRITAVMPFFGYRRQEKVSGPGESLGFQLAAELLKAAGVGRVLVIDLHKHRSAKFFKEVEITSKELRAFDVIVEYFKNKKLDNFVVLAPDKGGIPESERYAKALGVPLVKVYKHRSLTRPDEVTFDRFEGEVEGKNVLIIDDEINTAGTLVGVVEMLKKRKARNIYFACTHAVLSGPAIERLAKSRLKQVVVTDTIYLPAKKRLKKIKVLSVVPLFADIISKWSRRK